MRRLIVVAGLSLAILAGSVGEVAAATDDSYNCIAAGPDFNVAASGLTKEEARAFKSRFESQGFTVKCKKE